MDGISLIFEFVSPTVAAWAVRLAARCLAHQTVPAASQVGVRDCPSGMLSLVEWRMGLGCSGKILLPPSSALPPSWTLPARPLPVGPPSGPFHVGPWAHMSLGGTSQARCPEQGSIIRDYTYSQNPKDYAQRHNPRDYAHMFGYCLGTVLLFSGQVWIPSGRFPAIIGHVYWTLS